MIKVKSKIDFSWDGLKFQRGKIYEIETTPKFLEFIKVGYLTEFGEVVETKEAKPKLKNK